MATIVKIVCTSSEISPHDGRYLVSWESNVPFGELAVTSTDDKSKARRFPGVALVLQEWAERSKVQPNRPNDGRANKPLTALTITFEEVSDA